MAVEHAEMDQLVRGGRHWRWTLDADDVANTVTIDVHLTDRDEIPVAAKPGERGGVDVTLGNGQQRTFDFVALGYVNAGVKVIQNVKIRRNQQGRNAWLSLTPFFDAV